MNYRAILFDFDGVLCRDRFYEKALLPNHAVVYDWLQTHIFSNKELVRQWMRGEVTSDTINKLIAKNIGIDFINLVALYNQSIKMMRLDEEVMNLAAKLKLAGKKIAIVTDNMDVFSQITVSNHKLNALFDVVINSADHGLLKKDDSGALFDIALAALGEKIEKSLMIDDSDTTIDLYRQKGGQGFVYKNFEELKLFLQI